MDKTRENSLMTNMRCMGNSHATDDMNNGLAGMGSKKLLAAAMVALSLGSGVASAVTTQGNNFTMLSTSGGLQGGTNDVQFTWDGTFYTSVAAADAGGANATLSSSTTFFSYNWTAHHVKVYAPGVYTIYTGCAANNAACGAGSAYTLTVPAGYVGGHMLFDWNTSTDIDVIQLWKMSDSWANVAGTYGAALPNPFCNNVVGGPGCVNPNTLTAGDNIKTKVWDAVSMDAGTDADNWNGALMIDGPFLSSSANFSVMQLVASTTTLAMTSQSPASGATGASVVSPILVHFNKSASNVTNATFTVKRTSDNAAVAGTVACTNVVSNLSTGSAGADCTFTPGASLGGSTQYTATLSSAITDTATAAAFAGATWNFTTGTAQSITVSGATVTVNAPSNISSFELKTTSQLGGTLPFRTTFGDFVAYTVTGVPGATLQVDITFPSSIADKDIYKFKNGQYVVITETTTGCTFTRDANGTTLHMTITDRTLSNTDADAPCDSDTTTGTITDPIGGGVTTPLPALGAGGTSGGGCVYHPAGRDYSLAFILLAGLAYSGWQRRGGRS